MMKNKTHQLFHRVGQAGFALHHRFLCRAVYLFQFPLFRPKVVDQGLCVLKKVTKK